MTRLLLIVLIAMLALARAAYPGYALVTWRPVTQDVGRVVTTADDVWMYRVLKRTKSTSSWSTAGQTSGRVTEALVYQADGTVCEYAIDCYGRNGLHSGPSTNISYRMLGTPELAGAPAVTNWSMTP